MPSPLKHFGIDPNRKGRGSGLYYLRGNGMFSKYNLHRDSMIKASGWERNPVGPKKSSIKHAGDGDYIRRYR